jgi:hypothetical protein
MQGAQETRLGVADAGDGKLARTEPVTGNGSRLGAHVHPFNAGINLLT